MTTKLEITEQVIFKLGLSVTTQQAFDHWWYTKQLDRYFRLTGEGYEKFASAGLEHWSHELSDKWSRPMTLLLLSRKLTCPYYLDITRRHQNIVLFGSKEAVVYRLYGNTDQWLASLAQSD